MIYSPISSFGRDMASVDQKSSSLRRREMFIDRNITKIPNAVPRSGIDQGDKGLVDFRSSERRARSVGSRAINMSLLWSEEPPGIRELVFVDIQNLNSKPTPRRKLGDSRQLMFPPAPVAPLT